MMVRCVTEGTSTKVTDGVRRHDMIGRSFRRVLETMHTPLYLSENSDGPGHGGANAPYRVRRAFWNGADPLLHLAENASCETVLQAHSSTATVTQIVTDHGFWELGRFAVTYRAMFGETPSMSLQRPPTTGRFPNRPSSLASTLMAAHGSCRSFHFYHP